MHMYYLLLLSLLRAKKYVSRDIWPVVKPSSIAKSRVSSLSTFAAAQRAETVDCRTSVFADAIP